MIFLFRIITDEDQDFFRDLIADGSDTFLDFHRVLQKDLGYDESQLASFFITSEDWEKQQEITLIDMMQDHGPADGSLQARTMEEVTLDECLDTEGQRMIYLFDFFSDRAFFMELIETSEETSPRETPFIGGRKGDPPPQLALDSLVEDEGSSGDEFQFPEDLDDPDDSDQISLDDIDPDTLGI